MQRFYLVPISAACVCIAVSSREAYLRVYYTQHYLDKARGVRHDGPGVDVMRVRVGGYVAAAATFCVTAIAFKRAMYSILLSPRPAANRLFDRLTPSEMPPPLTLGRIWHLFGPFTAQPDAFRVFTSIHGAQAFCLATAAGWGLLLAPIAHARAESALAGVSEVSAKKGWGKAERDAALRQEADRLGLALGPSSGRDVGTRPSAAAPPPPPPPPPLPAARRVVVH
jgi:hypothetical protein